MNCDKFNAHFLQPSWLQETAENGARGHWKMARGHRKHFLCPLAIFQCPLASFSAVSCLQEGYDNRTIEKIGTHRKVRWGSVILYLQKRRHLCKFFSCWFSALNHFRTWTASTMFYKKNFTLICVIHGTKILYLTKMKRIFTNNRLFLESRIMFMCRRIGSCLILIQFSFQ